MKSVPKAYFNLAKVANFMTVMLVFYFPCFKITYSRNIFVLASLIALGLVYV